ncbi:hypothetical protein [Microbacterium sp. B19]|uniref:hypothetical protein n=1 Tax=Microbacterium sp. B19 TaxID=96765 RepID=UPI00034530F1|nr:hypothetical protein [Microbacterium sp. B19]
MSDDDVELNHLRERVYGEAEGPATEAEIARLAALEEELRAGRAPTSVAEPTAAEPAAPEPIVDAPPHRPRALAVIVAVVAAAALIGAGYAAGAASPSLAAASPTPSASMASPYPELAFPQTDDDKISSGIIADSGIDPASTRYIAVMRGFRVFLAERERGDGVCVVTFIAVNDQPWSAGCTAGGALDDGAVFGVDRRLSIALGDPSRVSIRGLPVRLSESVTAYLTE